jgi:YD repeat-containing protein
MFLERDIHFSELKKVNIMFLMRPKKYLFILLMAIVNCFLSYQSSCGQTGINNNDIQYNKTNIPKIVPPSPEAASLGKYGDISVSLFGGSPDISIPLGEIADTRIKVPISLMYNATGVKVNDIATNVGLSWTLSAGGAITRVIRGQPDKIGFYQLPPNVLQFQPNVGITADPYVYPDYDYAKKALDLNYDTEVDIYYFNFLGRSGKFFEDLKTGKFYTMPTSAIRISRIQNAGFRIVDENGAVYEFTTVESIYSQTQCTIGTPGARTWSDQAESAWYLSRIKDEQAAISFEYESYNYKYAQGRTETKVLQKSDFICANIDATLNKDCISYQTVYGKRIKRIVSERYPSEVIFNYTTQKREDLYNINGDDFAGNALISVVIKANGISIKQYDLSYDYLRSIGYSTSLPITVRANFSRLKLAKVKEDSKPAYIFEYNETNPPMPERIYGGQDHWGFFNGAGSGTQLPNIPELSFTNGTNRNPDSNFVKSNTIKKITYPTGGATEFDFECHFENYTDKKIGYGGLRIRKMTDYSGTNFISKVTNYNFKDYETDSTKSSIVLPQSNISGGLGYLNYYSKSKDNPSQDGYLCTYTMISSASTPSLGNGIDNNLGYRLITVTTGDQVQTGKSIYKYSSKPEDVGITPITKGNYEWCKGMLLENKNEKFDITANLFIPVQKKVNTYRAYHNENCFSDTLSCRSKQKVISNYKISTYVDEFIITSPLGGNVGTSGTQFFIDDYKTISALLYQEKVAETTYNSTGQVSSTTITKTEIDSLNNFLMKRSVFYTSKGDSIITTRKYPHDFSGTLVYDTMIARNNISPTIEEKTFRGTVSSYQTKTNFNLWNAEKLALPQTEQTAKQTNPLETEVTYNSYDNKGNLLQYTAKNGIATSVVWGYKQTYPVAKVVGASYAEILTALNQTDQNLPYLQNMDGAALTTELTKLRNNLKISKPLAQVFTYTYAPLVGTLTETDPNAKSIQYEYDNLNRLKNIKDYQGNIVKNFQYNYGNGKCGANCYILSMQTFNGTNTIGYPVGVFNVNGQLIGNATTSAQFVTLWNGNATNQAVGTLVATADPLKFNLTVSVGKSPPPGVTGCRYYQVDLPYNKLDAALPFNGIYADFGDGTGMLLGSLLNVNALPANTIVKNGVIGGVSVPYMVHTYPDNSLKTITLYHNDDDACSWFDNYFSPSTTQTLLTNLRGNLPQFTNRIGGSSYQQASMTSLAGITNWSSISSVIYFRMTSGDAGVTAFQNVSFPQNFMANNKDLEHIWTSYGGYYASGCRDTTFKLSRLKSDWNTYFTKLNFLVISDEHWNRENLSGLPNLKTIAIVAGTQLRTNQNIATNPPIPIPSSVIDNIIIQVAAGSGQTVTGGAISILGGGGQRTAASDAAVTFLQAKGWTITITQ